MKMLMKSITLERAIVCALFLVCLTISIFRPGYYRGGVSFSSKLRNDFSKTLVEKYKINPQTDQLRSNGLIIRGKQ